jgi:hypothetical protein
MDGYQDGQQGEDCTLESVFGHFGTLLIASTKKLTKNTCCLCEPDYEHSSRNQIYVHKVQHVSFASYSVVLTLSHPPMRIVKAQKENNPISFSHWAYRRASAMIKPT